MMNHLIRQPRWFSYSLALLLTLALSWGLTRPALATLVATNLIIGPIFPVNSEPNFLRVDFELRSDGGTVPLTGVVTVTGSWGGGCTVTLTAARNSLTSSGYVANGSCVSSPPAGVHTVTLTYSGDSNYAPSTSSPVEITAKFEITVGITAHTPDPSSVDGSVLVQYGLTPRRPIPVAPTGTVIVSDGINHCEATVAAGQCSLILETAGGRTLTASYAGDGLFRADSASVSHTVIGYPSTTNITADSPDPSIQGQAVTVSYGVVANDPSKGTPSGNVTVSDGVDSCTGTVAAGSCSLTLNTLGARTLTATYAGNSKFAGSASAGEPHTVNAPDTTPPVITASGTKADGTPYTPGTWTNQNVLVHFTCSDEGSGIATCPDDQVISPDGTFTAQGTARDNAVNSATASFGPIQIDKTAPVVTVTGVSNGASYTLGSVPAAGCSTADALSGVATPATLTTTGGNANGSGSVTATCSGATDKAGNSATPVSATYSVIYNWTGFFQPVDNLPTVNTVNAGQAIPVKFSLGGDFALTIFAAGYPKVQAVACGLPIPLILSNLNLYDLMQKKLWKKEMYKEKDF